MVLRYGEYLLARDEDPSTRIVDSRRDGCNTASTYGRGQRICVVATIENSLKKFQINDANVQFLFLIAYRIDEGEAGQQKSPYMHDQRLLKPINLLFPAFCGVIAFAAMT